MKQISLLAFLSLYFLVSCTQDADTVYSCDHSVNTWVKENLIEIQSMKREDWNSLEEPYKVAVYRAFSLKQRLDFWHQKLEEVKQLDWSIDEMNHIQHVENFIDSHIEMLMGHLSDEQADELELFFYQWQCFAIEQLGWDKKVCVAIAGVGNKMLDKKGNIQVKKRQSGQKSYGCHCNTGTLSDFCGSAGTCIEVQCDKTIDGCGWLFTMQCNGRCSGIR